MQEIWKQVNNFPNYEISNKKIIRNINSKLIMKQTIQQGKLKVKS